MQDYISIYDTDRSLRTRLVRTVKFFLGSGDVGCSMLAESGLINVCVDATTL